MHILHFKHTAKCHLKGVSTVLQFKELKGNQGEDARRPENVLLFQLLASFDGSINNNKNRK